MPPTTHRLAFERPIYDLEERLAKLEAATPKTPAIDDEIHRLRREITDLRRKIFGNLEPWQTVQVARHPDRPMTTDYLSLVFDEFYELHGDKSFGDDRAIRTGFAKLDQYKVMVVVTRKAKRSRNATRVSSAARIPRVIAKRSAR